MKGLINKAVLTLCCAAGLAATQGCYSCGSCGGCGSGCGGGLFKGAKDGLTCYDPCYPERYWYEARRNLEGAFVPQINNGHVLDQTVWNHHFEFDVAKNVGNDKLTPGGQQHLAYLARRRPTPDTVIYLQTAQDIAYDPAAPDKFPAARTELDNKRIKAIQDYLGAQTAGRPVSFQVVVHDPAEVGQSAVPVARAVNGMYGASTGILVGAGAGAVNVSGGR